MSDELDAVFRLKYLGNEIRFVNLKEVLVKSVEFIKGNWDRLLLIITSIIGPFITYFLGKRSERREREREVIDKYYIPIAKEVRSIRDKLNSPGWFNTLSQPPNFSKLSEKVNESLEVLPESLSNMARNVIRDVEDSSWEAYHIINGTRKDVEQLISSELAKRVKGKISPKL